MYPVSESTVNYLTMLSKLYSLRQANHIDLSVFVLIKLSRTCTQSNSYLAYIKFIAFVVNVDQDLLPALQNLNP